MTEERQKIEELPKIGYDRTALTLKVLVRRDLIFEDYIGFLEVLKIVPA